MFDEKTNAFLDNLVKGASNEELFKMERMPAVESTPQQVAKPVYEKVPERDLASEMILSFAPAIVGAFGGESAAIAQAPAGEKARKFYEDARKQEIEKVEARNKQAKESYADQTKQALDRKEREDKLRAQIQMAKESNALRKEIADQSSEDRKAIAGATRQEKSDKAAAGKLLPSGAVENLASSEAATNMIKELNTQLEGMKDFDPYGAANPLRYIKGTDAKNKIDAYDASLTATAQMVGKFLEGGKLTDVDFAKYKSMLPPYDATDAVKKAKINQIQKMIEQKQATDSSYYKKAGYSADQFQKGDVKSSDKKQVVKKFVNQKTGQTKYVYSDGSEEIK